MDTPQSKLELLSILRAEREHWESFLRQFSDTKMMRDHVESDWSVRDVISLILSRERLAGTRLYDELNGTPASLFDLYGENDLPNGFEEYDDEHQDRWLVQHSRNDPLSHIHQQSRPTYKLCNDH